MRLLVCTQKIDRNDPVLGFFHHWITVFAAHWDSIIVVCLQQGETDLPENVTVISLGKEQGATRLQYLWRFYRAMFVHRHSYDAVYVHMNQEYVLLGGIFWRMMGKVVSLWRNHHSGSWRTRLAGRFAHRVFCTSRFSFTASFPNTTLMPVGVDTEVFVPDMSVSRSAGELLFLARIAPAKKPHVLLRALAQVAAAGVPCHATMIGDPLPEHRAYAEELRVLAQTLGIADRVAFVPGIPNHETIAAYRRCAVFVNLSSNGMFDKTIFEAMACGALVCVSNKNLEGEIDARCVFPQDDVEALTKNIHALLALPPSDQAYDTLAGSLRAYVVAHHSLAALAQKLHDALTQKSSVV